MLDNVLHMKTDRITQVLWASGASESKFKTSTSKNIVKHNLRDKNMHDSISEKYSQKMLPEIFLAKYTSKFRVGPTMNN